MEPTISSRVDFHFGCFDQSSTAAHICQLSYPMSLKWVNPAFEKLTGYSLEEIDRQFSKDYSKLIHPDDVARFENSCIRLAHTESTETIVYRLLAKSGDTVPVVDTMTSRKSENGSMKSYSVLSNLAGVSVADLRNVCQSENAARSPHGYSNGPLHGAIYLTADGKPRVMHADEYALIILGFDKDKIHGRRNLAISMLENEYQAVLAQVQKYALAAEQHSPSITRHHIRTIKGGFVRVLMCASIDEENGVKVCKATLVCEGNIDNFSEQVEKAFESFENYSISSSDAVMVFDFAKNSLVFKSNNIEALSDVPTNAPLAASEWISKIIEINIAQEDKERVRDFLDIDSLSPVGTVNQGLFTLIANENRVKVNALAIGSGTKAILNLKQEDDNAPDSMKLYKRGLFIRTFGTFDVFVDGEPLAFKSKKAKEYLALLVDRRGSYVSSREAVLELWPDGPVGEKELARARKAAMNMRRTLESVGFEDIVESDGGSRRLIVSKVRCDLYEYLADPTNPANAFRGSYLSDYAWGETSLAELTFSMYD